MLKCVYIFLADSVYLSDSNEIISRRMRRAGHVARMGERYIRGFWWGNLRKIDHLEDQG